MTRRPFLKSLATALGATVFFWRREAEARFENPDRYVPCLLSMDGLVVRFSDLKGKLVIVSTPPGSNWTLT